MTVITFKNAIMFYSRPFPVAKSCIGIVAKRCYCLPRVMLLSGLRFVTFLSFFAKFFKKHFYRITH